MPGPGRLAAAALAIALTGCAAVHVGSYVDRRVDFSIYRTWDWSAADALPTSDPRLDNNQFFRDYFEGAVERGFAARRLVRASETPDLLVHYHANITRQVDVAALEREYQNCRGSGCYPSVIDYQAGTLIVDVVDARTDRLVWRGWAQHGMDGVIDDQDRLERHVTLAVEKMLQRFPGAL